MTDEMLEEAVVDALVDRAVVVETVWAAKM